jgi:hypothetical protein
MTLAQFELLASRPRVATHVIPGPCCGALRRRVQPGCAAGALVLCGTGQPCDCAPSRPRCPLVQMSRHQTVWVLASHGGRCLRRQRPSSPPPPRTAHTAPPHGSCLRQHTPARRRPLRSGRKPEAASAARRYGSHVAVSAPPLWTKNNTGLTLLLHATPRLGS